MLYVTIYKKGEEPPLQKTLFFQNSSEHSVENLIR